MEVKLFLRVFKTGKMASPALSVSVRACVKMGIIAHRRAINDIISLHFLKNSKPKATRFTGTMSENCAKDKTKTSQRTAVVEHNERKLEESVLEKYFMYSHNVAAHVRQEK